METASHNRRLLNETDALSVIILRPRVPKLVIFAVFIRYKLFMASSLNKLTIAEAAGRKPVTTIYDSFPAYNIKITNKLIVVK